jgi:hypothetical protein
MIEERDTAFYMSWLHRLIYDLAWPSYACELCVGQEEWRGCQCEYYGAIAPYTPPRPIHTLARQVWSFIARRCEMYDPAAKWPS